MKKHNERFRELGKIYGIDPERISNEWFTNPRLESIERRLELHGYPEPLQHPKCPNCRQTKELGCCKAYERSQAIAMGVIDPVGCRKPIKGIVAKGLPIQNDTLGNTPFSLDRFSHCVECGTDKYLKINSSDFAKFEIKCKQCTAFSEAISIKALEKEWNAYQGRLTKTKSSEQTLDGLITQQFYDVTKREHEALIAAYKLPPMIPDWIQRLPSDEWNREQYKAFCKYVETSAGVMVERLGELLGIGRNIFKTNEGFRQDILTSARQKYDAYTTVRASVERLKVTAPGSHTKAPESWRNKCIYNWPGFYSYNGKAHSPSAFSGMCNGLYWEITGLRSGILITHCADIWYACTLSESVTSFQDRISVGICSVETTKLPF